MMNSTEHSRYSPLTPRPFGFWTAVSLVVGNMVGTGIYVLPAALAQYGSISLLGYALTALGAICLAYVFANLILHNPRSGGPYTYGQEVFGKLTGFLVAWGYWTMNWTGSAATAVAVVSYLSTFIPALAVNRLLSLVYACFIVWGVTIVNCLGLRIGGRVQVVLTFLKLLPLLVIPCVSLFWFQPENFALSGSIAGGNWTVLLAAISGSAAFSVWSFVGLESATVPTDKISNPRQTVVLATLCGTTAAALLYFMTLVGLFGLLPVEQLANSGTPFVDATRTVTGFAMSPLIAICIIVSGLGGLNGWILLHGQVPEAMAKDGLFPCCFAKTSPQGVPRVGLIVGSILITILLTVNYKDSLLDQFILIVTVASVMTLFAYLVSSLAALVLIRRKPLFSMVCVIASCYSLWAIWGVGLKILILTAVAYIIGIPIHAYTQKIMNQRRVKS